MRKLAEALKQHTNCGHRLSLSFTAPLSGAITHAGGTQQFSVAEQASPAESGSAIFHELARRIVGDGAHTITSLSISDAEYESYLSER